MIIRRAILSDVVSLVRLLKQLFALEKDFVCDVEKQTAGFKLLVESSRDIILVAETEKEVHNQPQLIYPPISSSQPGLNTRCS